eukprot:450328_1
MEALAIEAFQRLDPESYYRRFLSRGVRPDGRTLLGQRKLKIKAGVLSYDRVASSSLVQMGQTKVLAGSTLRIGAPSASSPGQGEAVLSVSIPPLCGSQFGGTRRRGRDIEKVLESIIYDVIIGSGLVQTDNLCIERGKSAWHVCVDLVCLSYGGNITDATILAALVCLRGLVLPDLRPAENGGWMLEVEKEGRSIIDPEKEIPVPLSLGVFKGKIIADPSEREEEILVTRLTFAQTASGQLTAIRKPGGKSLSEDQLLQCLALSREHAKRISKLIDTVCQKAAAAK